MKDRGADRVFVCTTFGLFTDGFEKFDEFYANGYIDRVITTNLTYLPAEAYEKPYFVKRFYNVPEDDESCLLD